ncbi:MAG: methylenetetrahydrofolate--tRNA-(uracil(54)-C(5))-methyltransferase (FADH(2)-oxidizing) TrmFO [Planctomycetota bacterium]|nr:MAG: methylenetetrahydrofolate--tRNA-(uracil(54)-C(5))-methyltransferase (FADH(2)-oxidizing) TrmFO [Planctomycetota bacterium]
MSATRGEGCAAATHAAAESSTVDPAEPVLVVGGGMAGVEAARVLSAAGVPVRLVEMRPVRKTDAHASDQLAEVVCSNSLGSLIHATPKGLLLAEMEAMGSLVVAAAKRHAVPAGSSLAVDREAFAADVTACVSALPGVELVREELTSLPEHGQAIVATGPLTSDALAADIERVIAAHAGGAGGAAAGGSGQEGQEKQEKQEGAADSDPAASQPSGLLDNAQARFSGGEPREPSAATGPTPLPDSRLYFYDAIAPIVSAESLDRSVIFEASRYGRGEPDFLNCPFTEEQYDAFLDALLAGEVVPTKEFEQLRHFEGCMPIEELASRGRRTLAFGAMRPVGLSDPRTGRRPYAVVQLRREDQAGQLYNLVGFQTKLRYGEQARIFRLIPGLGQAEFVRLGSLHRNTFINSPEVLGPDLSLKARRQVWFAGQVTGVEGYAESAATGILAALAVLDRRAGRAWEPPPPTSMLGALMAWMAAADPAHFQPMNVNFGLVPPLPERVKAKRERKQRMAERALVDLDAWLSRRGFGPVLAGRPEGV